MNKKHPFVEIPGNPLIVLGPSDPAECKPELRFRKLTDEEIAKVPEEARAWREAIEPRLRAIEEMPPEFYTRRVR